MAVRVKLPPEKVTQNGSYFADQQSDLDFVPSGCKVLDLALGGGWPLGRVSNIVGDKSTGKTLLAIEGCSNFARRFKKGKIFYREAESAFDKPYAAALGMPIDRVDFGKQRLATVEEFHDDLKECAAYCKRYKMPGYYVLDSLDALSDDAEMKREITEGSYGAAKAKKMSELFRKLVGEVGEADIHLQIISQIRDKIGVVFGKKYSRTGGHALDFYASQVLWLSNIGQITKKYRGHERTIGVEIKGKVEKNKIGLPFREAEFDIIFGFGTDDLRASVMWLKEMDWLADAGIKAGTNAKERDAAIYDYLDEMNARQDVQYWEEVERVGAIVAKRWREVDNNLLPTRNKSGQRA